MKTTSILTPLLPLLFAGCAIGPDYEKPQTSAPASFYYSENNSSTTLSSAWWNDFKDEQLTQSVEQALKNNFDLISANASVEAMLGKFDTAKSYLYPQINANASLTEQGVSNTDTYQLRNGVTSTYAANLSLATYEIDLFGKVRRANEAARAMLLASDYSRQTLRISIASNVAASYIRLSSLTAQIGLAKENIKASEEINSLNSLKYTHGTIAQTILLQSQSELQSAKATLAQLEASKISEESTFNQLLARNPERINTTTLEKLALPSLPSALPSEILQHRPDIALSEQNLIAANAQIGIARAAYYPSIQLTGMAGVQSLDLQDLTLNPTTIWKILPTITLPIFSAGRIAGQVKTAEAEHNQTLMAYQKIIISAFNDADNAIGQNSKASQQLSFQQERSNAIKTAFEQSKMRYNVGTISYNDLLIVQQQWIAAQQAYLIARQNALTSTINLYKAFGGGWKSENTINIPSLFPAGR